MDIYAKPGWKLLAAGVLTAKIIFLFAGVALARIPEPDNIIYGLPGNEVVTVTLKVNGQMITSYTMGDNPNAGPYYLLRIPIDALDPQEEGTARPGDTAAIYLNDGADPAVTAEIGVRGTVQKIHLSFEDTDQDGLLDVVEQHELGTNPNSDDTDGDTWKDGWEVQKGFDPKLNDAVADSDSDTHANMNEYFAESDPWNPLSTPAAITVPLKKGFNIIAIPAEIRYRPDLSEWLGAYLLPKTSIKM
jgi:hypothetical protein